VGLFGRKKDQQAATVSAPATIERVCATGREMQKAGFHGNDMEDVVHHTFMVFRFADQRGAEVIAERELWVGKIRPPGSTTQIVYAPDDVEGTLDYDRNHVRWPDPAVPRGWSAGAMQIAPLGTRCAVAPDPALDGERALFVSGRRAQATVMDHHIHVLGGVQGNLRVTLKLQIDGQDIETDVRTFPMWVPHGGARIEVAIGADGSLALDTDERYYGPPGRLLVYAEPDPSAPVVVPDQISAMASQSPAVAQIYQQVMSMKRVRVQMGKHYEPTIHAILDGQRRAGQIDDAAYQQLLSDALS
jgi:hypothetical protein